MMLTHSVAPQGLLLSTLVPIPKNKRGNKCDSNNYRQIAISSLLGKIFDTIILDKQKICSHDENVIIDNAITDMNMRLNNLLSEFSHCDSGTLSTLFRTYCMNIYGCQTWRYNSNYLDKFYTTWRKAGRRVWKIPYRTHNKLVHLINKSCSLILY